MSQARYLRVAVPAPLHRAFDYLPPAGVSPAALLPGMRVRVPFGRRKLVGILMDTVAHSSVPESRLRPAQRVLDDAPVIPATMLALAQWAADYYHHPLGDVMQALLPVALRQGKALPAMRTLVWRLTGAGKLQPATALRRAPRQAALFSALQKNARGFTAAMLDQACPDWRPAMRALIARGWVEKEQIEIPSEPPPLPTSPSLSLNAAQQTAVDTVRSRGEGFHAWLLNGVTGSGKTEVYLELIAQTLRAGRQALVLVPEIGLTPQLLARFRMRLGEVAVFHSGLNESERLHTWLAARDGRARVVVGTRSAIFLPLQQPGLLVVDEEHDISFKQQDGLRYSARDLAVMRAQQAAVPVVLGSATPSLESLYNVQQGRYTQLSLTERAGLARPPRIRLLDLRGRTLDEGLSPRLLESMQQHLDAGGQALLFLNRRGYAPTLLCHACGQTVDCRRCDAHLTLHGSGRLQCHHCGAQRPQPVRCEHCGASAFAHVGYGTERIEAALQRLFPAAGVVRIDRDSTRRRGSLESLLAEIRAGRHRILIGTQMLAKGHDFPQVSLAAIVDADQGLFGADFRAAERMAQLVTQVAGRAGRAARAGEVLIQTHHPEHPLLHHLIHEGYASFAAAALDERRLAGLPPFAGMILLRAEAASAAPPRLFLEAARNTLRQTAGRGVEILGPVPAPMERRAGRYRAQLMLLAPRRTSLQAALDAALPALRELKQARRVRWSVDVDPAETY